MSKVIIVVKIKTPIEGIWEGKSTISGNKITNSTSKITKIILIKKNWTENIERWNIFDENPHSKGLSFSISDIHFFLKINPKDNKTEIKISTSINREITIFISEDSIPKT